MVNVGKNIPVPWMLWDMENVFLDFIVLLLMEEILHKLIL